MVGMVIATPQVLSTRRKIVRSRELALINTPLHVNEVDGHPVASARSYIAMLTTQRPIIYKWEVVPKPFNALDASIRS